jgi:hypothetical protein
MLNACVAVWALFPRYGDTPDLDVRVLSVQCSLVLIIIHQYTLKPVLLLVFR